ncbi:unnamed protein product [Schistosoma turkestanicum]|nr:unnamed protein product [Schistosoma turkestanicum]
MKKLKHCDSVNSKYSLLESRKDHINKLDVRKINLQSTSKSSKQISGSHNTRRIKCITPENSTSAKKMHKSDLPYLKLSHKKNIYSSPLTDNISAVNISNVKQQNFSKPLDYLRRIVLPFSENSADNKHEFMDFPTSSIYSNRYSVENSWSNLWRSGLPEQKLTIWLPRRFTGQDDEHLQCKLNKTPSSIKLHKLSFPDLDFLEQDNSFTMKTTQKCSPQIKMTSNSYWTLNAHCADHNANTNINNDNNNSANNSRLSNNLRKNGGEHLTHSNNSNSLTIMGNSYPINRPPDIKEKTLAQLSLIKKEENCTTSINSNTNVKGYMDPMVGAPVEFLNRLNALSKLQAVTKRWERTQYRRQVKKEMIINKSVVEPIR